ncbi:MAG: hypothetical protein IPJ34_01385 [Myxococcales bacterium]|nr:hypothetical protein [Myxococcales bacterium]
MSAISASSQGVTRAAGEASGGPHGHEAIAFDATVYQEPGAAVLVLAHRLGERARGRAEDAVELTGQIGERRAEHLVELLVLRARAGAR